MARTASGQPDRRRAGVASTDTGQTAFTAAGQASPWVPLEGPFIAAATGGTGGTFAVDASFDGGTTSIILARPDGTSTAYTAPLAMTLAGSRENDVVFRIRCIALSAGSMEWRISQ